MGAKLHSKPSDETIPALDLSDGQVAVITRWGNGGVHVGSVVQMVEDSIVSIGCRCLRWDHNCGLDQTHRVRVLQPGELIEVT